MSAQNNHKLSAIVRSIETIEAKTNSIYSEYTTTNNEIDHLQAIYIDDTNRNLQSLFQHVENLLQIDLKNRKSLLNTKRNYWNFFVLALKESKGLYDTVLYVLNSQEVKTPIGRGRLFLRFCLQNHRLGDVLQQSFMLNNIVRLFYNDDCFWTKSAYLNRICQAIYQLNDVQFDILSNSQYQLDVCWPTAESVENRLRNSLEATSRLRTSSISSLLSMDSINPQMAISSSFPNTSKSFRNCESLINDDSSVYSMSSIDEYAENTLDYWKDRCQQLEIEIQSKVDKTISNDVEIQCSIDKNDQIIQTTDDVICLNEDKLKVDNEKLQCRTNILQDEINDLNFQLSTLIIHRTKSENKIQQYDREIVKYKKILETKDNVYDDLKNKYDEQTKQIKMIQEENTINLNKQNKKIEYLTSEVERMKKLYENERDLFEKEQIENEKIKQKYELIINEKTLDFEEMKRRLVKAIREKADLFNSIYSYEIKLEQEQSKQFVHEDDVLNCTQCETAFGWTLKKYRCRQCQKIFCYYCCNNWQPGSTPNSRQRLCSMCHEKHVKESLMSNYTILEDPSADNEAKDDVDLKFEVRPECLPATTDNSLVSSE